jgi:hypothetical protein
MIESEVEYRTLPELPADMIRAQLDLLIRDEVFCYSLVGGNRYGKGVWAPSIRKHDGLCYVYFPTPREGIYVNTAKEITGPWSAPEIVIAQAGKVKSGSRFRLAGCRRPRRSSRCHHPVREWKSPLGAFFSVF